MPLIGGALAIGLTGLLLINGHRINYMELGGHTLIDAYNGPRHDRDDTTDDDREQYR